MAFFEIQWPVRDMSFTSRLLPTCKDVIEVMIYLVENKSVEKRLLVMWKTLGNSEYLYNYKGKCS